MFITNEIILFIIHFNYLSKYKIWLLLVPKKKKVPTKTLNNTNNYIQLKNDRIEVKTSLKTHSLSQNINKMKILVSRSPHRNQIPLKISQMILKISIKSKTFTIFFLLSQTGKCH